MRSALSTAAANAAAVLRGYVYAVPRKRAAGYDLIRSAPVEESTGKSLYSRRPTASRTAKRQKSLEKRRIPRCLCSDGAQPCRCARMNRDGRVCAGYRFLNVYRAGLGAVLRRLGGRRGRPDGDCSVPSQRLRRRWIYRQSVPHRTAALTAPRLRECHCCPYSLACASLFTADSAASAFRHVRAALSPASSARRV